MSESKEIDSVKLENSSEVSDEEIIDGIPEDAKEILDKLPPEVRREMFLLLSHQRIGLPTNPIAKKLTSEHVGKIIEYSENDSEREFKDSAYTRRYSIAYFIIGLLFLGVVLSYPQIDKALLIEFLKVLLGFIGGFGAASYFEKRRKKDE